MRATEAWHRGNARAVRRRLEPVQRVAPAVKRNQQEIVNAVMLERTNARTDAILNDMQGFERLACVFRRTERYPFTIYFHLAALGLHPRPPSTHTKTGSG